MQILEQAKKLFNHVHLIVGVTDSETVAASLLERMQFLENCKWVNQVIQSQNRIDTEKISKNFIERHNIHYVVGYDRVPGFTWAEDRYSTVK